MSELRRLAEPMNAGCCACRAKATCRDPEEATVVLLVASLLEDGLSVEDWYDMLCFYHRRQVDNAVEADEPKPEQRQAKRRDRDSDSQTAGYMALIRGEKP
jgi:hypothetical protein